MFRVKDNLRETPLSPVDLVFTGSDAYSIEFLLRFSYRIDSERLNEAIAWAGKKFFPVNSRLVEKSATKFVLAENETKLGLSRVVEITQMPDLENPQSVALLSQKVVSKPGNALSAFALYYCGGESLLVANISHAVVDGFSYFMFLNFVAARYRTTSLFSLKTLQLAIAKPLLDRSVLCLKGRKKRSVSSDEVLFQQACFENVGLSYSDRSRTISPADAHWDFVSVSDQKLTALHKDAQQKTSEKLSRHDVLTAYLWKSFSERWRDLPGLLSCTNAFDIRRIFGEHLRMYFGNGIIATSVQIDQQELRQMHIGEIAARVRQVNSAVTVHTVNRSLRCLNEYLACRGLSWLQRLHVSNPDNGLLVTNLSRVSLEALDFGDGAVSELIPLTSARRVAIVMPGIDGVRVRVES
jgi:hypothetical protein